MVMCVLLLRLLACGRKCEDERHRILSALFDVNVGEVPRTVVIHCGCVEKLNAEIGGGWVCVRRSRIHDSFLDSCPNVSHIGTPPIRFASARGIRNLTESSWRIFRIWHTLKAPVKTCDNALFLS